MNPPDPDEIERYLASLNLAVERRLEEIPRGRLSTCECVFASIWELEAEVNNGGLSQFFANSSGEHALDAPAALRTIGAVHAAELVDAAIQIVGAELPWADGDARHAAISNLTPEQENALDALDNKFFSYPDNLSQLLYIFCSAHRSEFPD